MSNPNYPPGPWECEEQWHGTAIKVVGGGETVARVSPRADIRRESATAQLISAAPDLLEAAEMALGEIEARIVAPKLVAVLREVIAKAKGREDV